MLKRSTGAQEYAQILREARRQQLILSREALGRLEAVWSRAIDALLARIEQAPDDDRRREFYLSLLHDLNDSLAALRSDYAALLEVGMIEAAQAAADRTARIEVLLSQPVDAGLQAREEYEPELTLHPPVTVRFGRVSLGAVQALSKRVYSDGLNLSDRLYRLDEQTKATVGDTLVQGIAEQVSAREMARRLQEAFASTGQQTPRYNAMRIARTEINNAHRESCVQSAIGTDGQAKEYLVGVRWNLSLSHIVPDICDVWAAHDEGNGEGVYQPDSVPVDHPHGLCYLTYELREFPGVIGPGKSPDVDAVPQSQIDYYAGRGDAAASRMQQIRNA